MTEFNYRIADPAQAHVFIGLTVAGREETDRLIAQLHRAGLKAVDLSDNEMAKLHVRHLVGGRAPGEAGEMIYRFEFPERPGALMNFLKHMGSGWNISLFHYRNHGADVDGVLVGLAGPGQGPGRLPPVPQGAGLRLRGRDAQPRLPALPEVRRTGR